MIDYAVFLGFTKIFSPIVKDCKSSVLSVSTPLYTFIVEDLLQVMSTFLYKSTVNYI